jgi:NMD protein affecting ribosome stability and mRNA decay
MRKLKERCYSCGKPIDPTWRMCPYCEAETNAPAPSTTRRRRRQTTDQATVAHEAPDATEVGAEPEPAEAATGETSRRRRR